MNLLRQCMYWVAKRINGLSINDIFIEARKMYEVTAVNISVLGYTANDFNTHREEWIKSAEDIPDDFNDMIKNIAKVRSVSIWIRGLDKDGYRVSLCTLLVGRKGRKVFDQLRSNPTSITSKIKDLFTEGEKDVHSN